MMKLAPKVLTGSLHPANKGACDWGWQGMLAHGSQSFVVVIDPKTVQNIQVLEGHKANVTKLKWAHESYHHDIGSPYMLRLASADTTGTIIVWDVAQGYIKAEFSEGSRSIQDLQWVSGQDASRDLLVALHPPYSMIVWNADTGTKLWKKSYTEPLLSFAFDPFDPKQVAFLGQDCIVFIHDFTITRVPSSNGKKFYISSPSSPGNVNNNAERRESSTLAKRVSRILVGEVKQSSNKSVEESVNLNECIQLVYHQACRHHLILLYPRELLILDLEINQTVGTIPMERTGSPFTQILSCRQRDALMCLHDNGSVTVRVRRKTNVICTPASEGTGAFDDTPPQVSLDVAYDLRCQSDPMRLTKHSKVLGVAMSPVTERGVALIMSDSRVIFWEIKTINVMDNNVNNQAFSSPLYTPGVSLTDFSQLTINNKPEAMAKLPILSDVPYPRLTMADLIGQSQNTMSDSVAIQPKHTVVMKLLLTGLISGVMGHVSVLRMCPPMTTKNWSYFQPLLALGTQTGYIQIYNLSSGQLVKEYSVHTSIIRGIEWVNLNSFLSFSFPNPGTNNLVKNEVMLVDVVSGKMTPVRKYKGEESPIEFIKVSCLKQYFAVCFKDQPFELWDMKTLTLLREMPKRFPTVTALEWSPSHAIKTLKRRLLQRHESPPTNQEAPPGPAITAITDPSGSDSKNALRSPAKEHVIITDSESVVYHFIVEGSTITDSSKIPAEPGMAVVNSIAWKGDQIIFGDVEGHINIWDLKNKKSKYFPTNRGWVKKIRFAPGRGNMRFLAMFSSGLEIWDAVEGKSLYSIKTPKEMSRIIDAEWSCSDKPVITTEDGCVRVMDLKLTTASAAVEERDLPEPVFCPHLLSSKAALLLKCLLQHQPWKTEFSLKLEGMEESDAELEKSINQQLEVLDHELSDYLPVCKFGTAHRCLLVARLFGDESETHFWTVALHYLRTNKISPISKPPSRVSSQTESSSDVFVPGTPGKETSELDLEKDTPQSSSISEEFRDQPLERCYDVLCDKESFQKYQLDRVALHDSKRATYEHTKKCAENYILLGQTDRAVQLLLETESENDSYYVDSLLACLVASIRSSGASQSTIKLVATNLIANGRLSEGVQLLCLIDKGLDACRYLQTYGVWHQAAWLAKASLQFSEYSEVMKRWADHLCGPHANQKSKAVLVMLSLGQFLKVVEMLYGMRHFDRAVCFLEACMEFGLLEKTEETSPLFEAVYLEYARYLTNLRHRKAAEYYCELAGDKGAQFLKEVEILFG
ncbi:WD repeat-containing protein 11-like [Liolophura sinensis]|uniref:WD repeat-containing protein 11-like n=1 Tax=Liolophura sinensis TaxID=3198878 RepID=UPI0031585B48